MQSLVKMSPGAIFIEERMNKHGHRADIVGGSVRDSLLGIPVSDFDMTTDATPEEIKEIFSDLRIIETGIQHGTVTVMAEGEAIELTTYRIDGGYRDHRHPDEVEFTRSLSEDLKRRDFTVNAMAYSSIHGLTDLFSGREDLDRKIIRAVGDPTLRFDEDALRILRALRFSAVLGFEIEERTAEAIYTCSGLLSAPSKERIYTEWKKLIAGEYSYGVIDKFRDVIGEFIPSVRNCTLPDEGAWRSASPMARMASLFLGEDDPVRAFCDTMHSLRSDSATVEIGKAMLSNYNDPDCGTVVGQRMLLREMSEEKLSCLSDLRRLMGVSSPGEESILPEILEKKLPYRLHHLKIGGREIMSIGISGRNVGETLDALLVAVIKGECENEACALLSLASKINGKT